MSRGMVPEVVEWDCQNLWRRGALPDYIQEDLKKCNQMWVPLPKVPETPRLSLAWEWVWHSWAWREGPFLPTKARFDLSVEVHLPDREIDTLRQKAYDDMLGKMLSIVQNVDFAVYLCLGEKYRQGLVVEEPGCAAYLTKSLVLLGRTCA